MFPLDDLPFQLLVYPRQLGRALDYPLLQLFACLFELFLDAVSLYRVANGAGNDMIGELALDEVVLGAKLYRFKGDALVPVGGDDHNGYPSLEGEDRVERGEPFTLRKIKVKQKDIRPIFYQGVDAVGQTSARGQLEWISVDARKEVLYDLYVKGIVFYE